MLAYKVPEVEKYTIRIYLNSVDIYPQNDTLPLIERITNLNDDIKVSALVNPAGWYDKVDSLIDLEVTLENLSPKRTFDTVEVNALISDGVNPDIMVTEIITNFAAGTSRNCKFIAAYTVPAVENYTITVFINNIDRFPHNDTLPPVTRLTNVGDDISLVALINPDSDSPYDNVGDAVYLEVKLENHCLDKIYDTVVINAQISSTGNQDISWSETITNVAKGSLDYQFTSPYTVPSASEYQIKVFINNLDNYPSNDTLATVTRKTDLKINNYSSTSFSLGQNIPNPANNNTRIEYSIPNDGQVIFSVYSITGQTLHIEKRDAYSGKNDIEFNTSNLANGIYYYSMEYNGERLVKKMTIRK
jgi:hypothetical protein